MKMKKNYILTLMTLLIISCPPPSVELPEESEKRVLTNISIGQEDGAVLLKWTDPQSELFTEVGISYAKLSDKQKSNETKIKKGIQQFSVSNLQIGETYIFYLNPYGGKEKLLEEPQSVAHQVTALNCKIVKADFKDLYADFEWIITGEGQYKTVEVSVGDTTVEIPYGLDTVTIELDPGKEYPYAVKAKDGSMVVANASGKGYTMLFYEDFSGADAVSEPRTNLYSKYPNPKISDEGDAPRRTAWDNPTLDVNYYQNDEYKAEGAVERVFEDRVHGFSTWCHALARDWSMIEFGEDTDSTNYIRFKGEQKTDNWRDAKGSAVQSRDWFYFTFGKIEFRARISKGGDRDNKGHFPALWLMPQFNNAIENGLEWPRGGEIDIYEHVYHTPGLVWQTHFTANSSGAGNPTTWDASGNYYAPTYHVTNNNGSLKEWQNWNTFGLEWTPNGLQYYINGRKTKSIGYSENVNQFPFTKEAAFYIIMNMGVGTAENGGMPGAATKGFESWFDVDYVKVEPNQYSIVHDCPYYKLEKERRAKINSRK